MAYRLRSRAEMADINKVRAALNDFRKNLKIANEGIYDIKKAKKLAASFDRLEELQSLIDKIAKNRESRPEDIRLVDKALWQILLYQSNLTWDSDFVFSRHSRVLDITSKIDYISRGIIEIEDHLAARPHDFVSGSIQNKIIVLKQLQDEVEKLIEKQNKILNRREDGEFKKYLSDFLVKNTPRLKQIQSRLISVVEAKRDNFQDDCRNLMTSKIGKMKKRIEEYKRHTDDYPEAIKTMEDRIKQFTQIAKNIDLPESNSRSDAWVTAFDNHIEGMEKAVEMLDTWNVDLNRKMEDFKLNKLKDIDDAIIRIDKFLGDISHDPAKEKEFNVYRNWLLGVKELFIDGEKYSDKWAAEIDEMRKYISDSEKELVSCKENKEALNSNIDKINHSLKKYISNSESMKKVSGCADASFIYKVINNIGHHLEEIKNNNKGLSVDQLKKYEDEMRNLLLLVTPDKNRISPLNAISDEMWLLNKLADYFDELSHPQFAPHKENMFKLFDTPIIDDSFNLNLIINVEIMKDLMLSRVMELYNNAYSPSGNPNPDGVKLFLDEYLILKNIVSKIDASSTNNPLLEHARGQLHFCEQMLAAPLEEKRIADEMLDKLRHVINVDVKKRFERVDSLERLNRPETKSIHDKVKYDEKNGSTLIISVAGKDHEVFRKNLSDLKAKNVEYVEEARELHDKIINGNPLTPAEIDTYNRILRQEERVSDYIDKLDKSVADELSVLSAVRKEFSKLLGQLGKLAQSNPSLSAANSGLKKFAEEDKSMLDKRELLEREIDLRSGLYNLLSEIEGADAGNALVDLSANLSKYELAGILSEDDKVTIQNLAAEYALYTGGSVISFSSKDALIKAVELIPADYFNDVVDGRDKWLEYIRKNDFQAVMKTLGTTGALYLNFWDSEIKAKLDRLADEQRQVLIRNVQMVNPLLKMLDLQEDLNSLKLKARHAAEIEGPILSDARMINQLIESVNKIIVDLNFIKQTLTHAYSPEYQAQVKVDIGQKQQLLDVLNEQIKIFAERYPVEQAKAAKPFVPVARHGAPVSNKDIAAALAKEVASKHAKAVDVKDKNESVLDKIVVPTAEPSVKKEKPPLPTAPKPSLDKMRKPASASERMFKDPVLNPVAKAKPKTRPKPLPKPPRPRGGGGSSMP